MQSSITVDEAGVVAADGDRDQVGGRAEPAQLAVEHVAVFAPEQADRVKEAALWAAAHSAG